LTIRDVSMKFSTVADCLNFSWDQFVVAFWARYPNPFASHVLTEDVLRRELRPDGTLYTCRLVMKTNSVPSWGKALMPAKRVPILEESIVDPKSKTMKTYCTNVTHKSLMETTEKVVYTSQLDDQGCSVTHCDRMFWVSSKWVAPTRHLIERFGVNRWNSNVRKTKLGFELVLKQIYDEDGLEQSVTQDSTIKVGSISMHPFILEKRRMLREKATIMGQKAKDKFKQPLDNAKEKLERTRENAKLTIERTKDTAMSKIEKTKDTAFSKIENAQDKLDNIKFGVLGAEG